MRIWPRSFERSLDLMGEYGVRYKGDTTVTTTVPPKTDTELALETQSLELAQIQVAEAKQRYEMLRTTYPQQQKLLQAQVDASLQLIEVQKQAVAQSALVSAAQTPYLVESIGLAREEAAARKAQLPLQAALTEAQITALTTSTGIQQQQLEAMKTAAGSQAELLASIKEATQETPNQKQIRELSEQKTLDYLQGKAPVLSPEQQARINTAYGAAEAEGTAGIRQFAEEAAASRGMALTDSPIGAQVLPEVRKLQQNLAGAKASAELNAGTAEQTFNQTIQEFQANLRQQAYNNRLALLGQGSGTGLTQIPTTNPTLANISQGDQVNPLAMTTNTSGASSAINQMLATLGQERYATATKTTSGGGGFDPTALIAPIAGVLAAPFTGGTSLIGSAMSGMGGLFKSSARYKRDILPLDFDEYDAALGRVRETPITRYRYKWEKDRGPKHIGPILELAPEEITDDGHTVNLLDYTGLLHASVKAVDRDVRRLRNDVVALTRGKDGRHAESIAR